LGFSPTLFCLVYCFVCLIAHPLVRNLFPTFEIPFLARIYIRCTKKRVAHNRSFFCSILVLTQYCTLISGTKLLLFFYSHKYFSKKNYKNNNLIYAIAIYMFNNIFLETYSVSIDRKTVSYVVFSVKISAE
jgi:hypothetical protein